MDNTEHIQAYRKNGFTLVELLITMAIFVILITVAIPSFSALIERSSVSSAINLLRDSHAYARLEAVKRQQKILICNRAPVVVVVSCAGAAASGLVAWNNGLLIFIDADGDRLYTAKSDDELLKLVDFPDSIQVTFRGGDSIWLKAEGTSRNGTFTVFTKTSGSEQKLTISRTGRARTER